MTTLVLGWEEVEHGTAGEGGEVPDGLYPGDGTLSLQECVRPGTDSQLRSLHDLGLNPHHHPKGTHQVP